MIAPYERDPAAISAATSPSTSRIEDRRGNPL
jgi:hypothetical protein